MPGTDDNRGKVLSILVCVTISEGDEENAHDEGNHVPTSPQGSALDDQTEPSNVTTPAHLQCSTPADDERTEPPSEPPSIAHSDASSQLSTHVLLEDIESNDLLRAENSDTSRRACA